jgi:ankyrin repeat protein
VAQTRHTALQICKKWGFVSESLDEIDDNGETPLHSCAAQADVRAVKLLLEAGAVVDIQDDEGTTALGEAALGGINDTLAMLLQAGADPNSANFVDGRTPLIGAGSRLQCSN